MAQPRKNSDLSQVHVVRGKDFLTIFASSYQQGEHVSIVGPTGSGKTYLGLQLCKIIGARQSKDRRPTRVTVLVCKPRDDTMRAVLPKGEWPIIKKWPPALGEEHCIVWLRGNTIEATRRKQALMYRKLLDRMYHEGGQAVFIPEAAHFERKPPEGLGMSGTMTELWTSARSLKLTVISDTQRPRWVTVSMWTEPSWVIIFRPDDMDDLRRVAHLSGKYGEVWEISHNLGEHEFICIRRQRGTGGKREVYISKVD